MGSFTDGYPALSRDQRWLALVSDQAGRQEVYGRPMGAPYFAMVRRSVATRILVIQNLPELVRALRGDAGER